MLNFPLNFPKKFFWLLELFAGLFRIYSLHARNYFRLLKIYSRLSGICFRSRIYSQKFSKGKNKFHNAEFHSIIFLIADKLNKFACFIKQNFVLSKQMFYQAKLLKKTWMSNSYSATPKIPKYRVLTILADFFLSERVPFFHKKIVFIANGRVQSFIGSSAEKNEFLWRNWDIDALSIVSPVNLLFLLGYLLFLNLGQRV